MLMSARRRVARFVFSMLLPVLAFYQFGLLSSCEDILTTFNPCGNIFGFCTEEDIDLLFATIPDYGLDPTCTIPYACGTGPLVPNPGPDF